jgi:hypothetical protein
MQRARLHRHARTARALEPFVGVEAVPHIDFEGDRDSSIRVGPTLGVSFPLNPVRSQHGPFPISYERSLLASAYLDVGMAWWFGDDAPDHGEPGLTVAMEYAYGR